MKVKDVLPAISYSQDLQIVTVIKPEFGVAWDKTETDMFPYDIILRNTLENDYPEILEREMEGGLTATPLGIIKIRLKKE